MILAIETSTNICSVSFARGFGDREEIFEKRTERKGSHSELLFIFIRELMEEHDFKIGELDTVLVSNGPGSYTGLRIAASAVKGLLFGTDVPVYAANTLAGFAQLVPETAPDKTVTIHSIIDARRVHVYHQSFTVVEEKLKAIKDASIIKIADLEEMVSPGDIIIGTGIHRLSEEVRKQTKTFGPEKISATGLIRLFSNQPESEFLTETGVEELDSNYLTSSQVNNTER